MYYIFENEEEFKNWHNQVNQHFGYPNEERKTLQYTEGKKHLTDDRYYCFVDNFLPQQFVLQTYDRQYLLDNGFFEEEIEEE